MPQYRLQGVADMPEMIPLEPDLVSASVGMHDILLYSHQILLWFSSKQFHTDISLPVASCLHVKALANNMQ